MTSGKIKILFVTKNPGKFAEFKKAFTKLHRKYEIISFNDLPYDIPDCVETGTTFEENALLKIHNAKYHLENDDRRMIIIADDSGMKIDYLNGEPGVFTRRWNGNEMSDDEIINYCLSKLEGVRNRSASYVSCLVIATPDGRHETISDESLGVILEKPDYASKLEGMPFRSLFFVPELKLMFHKVRDLPISERGRYRLGHEDAIQKVANYIDAYYLQV